MQPKNAASQLTLNIDRKHQQKEKIRNGQGDLSSPAAFRDLFAVLLTLFENGPSKSSKAAASSYPRLLDNYHSIGVITTKPYMMAEVFGAVSAGVGVAAAAGQLIDGIMKLHSFCSQIRNIPDDIQTAVDDLSTMVEVLEFVQVEMGHEIPPPQPWNLSSSIRVLSNLQQSSQQVGEVLEEMRIKLGKKKYWGRIEAVGMTKKLEKAGKRVENAQRMVLILLAAENRMTFRQSFNAQRRELTAISTRIFSISSAGHFAGRISRDTRAINDIESSNTTDEDPDTAGPAPHQPVQRTSKAKGRDIAIMKLRLPNLFLNSVWEFSFYKANQGWDISLRSYNIRPENAQIFEAIRSGDLSRVCELLHSGRASIWDRDPFGRGVLDFAASSCGVHGSAVLECLVKSGADFYGVDFDGVPSYFHLTHRSDYVDEQKDLRLIAGYKVFMSHRDWISTRPSTSVSYENSRFTSDIIDMFLVFHNPPEEIISSVLHEMWPPWKDMPPADRINTLFPEFGVSALTGAAISPLCIRAFLNREYIQEAFAKWDTGDKVKLIKYVFKALAEQTQLGLEKGVEEARLFLKDMHMTKSLINALPEVDPLRLFVNIYARKIHVGQKWWRLKVEEYVNAAQEGLNHYVSELMLLGVDMATAIDIEIKVLARQGEGIVPREIANLGGCYKIIAIDYGAKADDWYLWLSNPLDEWAGEFWDIIDHPERAIPGAWQED